MPEAIIIWNGNGNHIARSNRILSPEESCLKCRQAVSKVLLLVCVAAFVCTLIQRNEGFKVKSCKWDCTPTDVHLSLTETSGEMRVSWRTDSQGCGELVLFQEASLRDKWLRGFLWHVSLLLSGERSEGKESIHSSTDFCGSPANDTFFTMNMHSAVLTGLEPGVKYVYMIWDGCESWDFTAPIVPGGNEDEWKFVAFGNMGVGSQGQELVLNSIVEEGGEDNLGFVFANGDLSSAKGDNLIWESFMNSIQQSAAYIPWMVACGDEEYGLSWDRTMDPWGIHPWRPDWAPEDSGAYNVGGGECGLQLSWRFPMDDDQSSSSTVLRPPHASSSFPPFWYSFDYGVVHVVTLSSEHSLLVGSPQLEWLKRDLGEVNRCSVSFVIVFFHRALQSLPFGDATYETSHLAPMLEEALSPFQVDIVVTAHQHLYYRGCAFSTGKCEDGGVVQLVLGTGGQALAEVPSKYRERYEATWGYGRFKVLGDRIKFQFVQAGTKIVLDTFDFKRKTVCRMTT